MNDERMQSLLDSWYRDREVVPRDVHEGVAKVMANVPRTHQQGRWLPFRLFHRKAQTPTATNTTDYRPSPIPATNGHAPTVIGRTQTMLSPVKAITAGALVFALGGALLVAQPFGQQGSVPGAAPGAVTESPSPSVSSEVPVSVTGKVTEETNRSFPSPRSEGEIWYVDGAWWTITWEASDPRLSGEGTWSANWHEAETGTGSIGANTFVLDNPDGRWVGTGDTLLLPNEVYVMVNLSGEGGYDGLTARVLVHTDSTSDEPPTLVGVITPVEPPEFPEPVEPPAE